jgi:hypothetical protein
MRKILLVFSALILVFTLTACDNVCVGPECVTGTSGGATSDSIVKFLHIDGHGDETERDAFILFEFESTEYVKYQISYLSCTCREANVNYWQVAYVEINKITNDVRYLSFGVAGDGHYTGGMWGDSDPIPTNNKTLADFEADFFPWIVGKSLADFEGISVFTNDLYHEKVQNTTTIDETDMIDAYAQSSVSTNNIIRIIKTLLEYHEENYN